MDLEKELFAFLDQQAAIDDHYDQIERENMEQDMVLYGELLELALQNSPENLIEPLREDTERLIAGNDAIVHPRIRFEEALEGKKGYEYLDQLYAVESLLAAKSYAALLKVGDSVDADWIVERRDKAIESVAQCLSLNTAQKLGFVALCNEYLAEAAPSYRLPDEEDPIASFNQILDNVTARKKQEKLNYLLTSKLIKPLTQYIVDDLGAGYNDDTNNAIVVMASLTQLRLSNEEDYDELSASIIDWVSEKVNLEVDTVQALVKQNAEMLRRMGWRPVS